MTGTIGTVYFLVERAYRAYKRQSAINRKRMKATCKIIFVFIQIMVVLPGILEVEYPSPFNDLLSYLQYIAFSFALADVGIKTVGLSCYVGTSYYSTFWVAVIGPPIFLLVLLICFLVFFEFKDVWNMAQRRKRQSVTSPAGIRQKGIPKETKEILVTSFLAICFVVMPISTTIIFNTLSCEQFDDETRNLRADYAIDCDTDEHKVYEYLALFLGIPLYPLGIPLIFMVLLWSKRKHLKDKRKVYIMYVPSKVRFEDTVEVGGINFKLLANVVKMADFKTHLNNGMWDWEKNVSENQVGFPPLPSL